MPTLAATLRNEIRRLAAKEVRRALRPLVRLQKHVKSFRLDSRGTRRTVASLENGFRRLRDRMSAQSLQGRVRRPSPGPRIAPRTIRALREGMRMTRVEFAKIVGVSPGSIYGWESGRTLPRGGSRARLAELLRKKGGGAGRTAGARSRG